MTGHKSAGSLIVHMMWYFPKPYHATSSLGTVASAKQDLQRSKTKPKANANMHYEVYCRIAKEGSLPPGCQSHAIVFSPHFYQLLWIGSDYKLAVHYSSGSLIGKISDNKAENENYSDWSLRSRTLRKSVGGWSNSYHHVRVQSSTVFDLRTTGGSYM